MLNITHHQMNTNKSQKKCHYTHPLQWLQLGRLTIPRVGGVVEQLEFLYIAGRNAKCTRK